jgi:dinuclear metal center YbgI/SA1388 family protein
VRVADIVEIVHGFYPPETAESWDAVGLSCGDPAAEVERILLVVDPVAETIDEAAELGAQLIISHHPLLLRGVHSVAASTPKGSLVHRLISERIALLTAHTNADVADPGVSDALAARFELTDTRPLVDGHGRVGELPEPMTLADFAKLAAQVLPASAVGVRAAGDPERLIRTVAVCGGAGDSFLADAAAAGVDAYVTADLRHHPVSEHLGAGGPALLDVGHWSSERPWLDDLAARLSATFAARVETAGSAATVKVVVSDRVTDPWTVLAKKDRAR